MRCRICDRESTAFFRARIMSRHDVGFFHCSHCGFFETEDPYWMEEAYREPINREDTGILSRNAYLADVSSTVLPYLVGREGRCLDYAGGYGILTRMLRDRGFDCLWHDKFTVNLFAREFEYPEEGTGIGAITCFEAFEHFPEPMAEIGAMLSIARNILFSTELLPLPPPLPGKWWYYGLEHGQHVSFYTLRTLRYIADKCDLKLLSNGRNIHLLTEKRIWNPLFTLLVRLAPYGLGKFSLLTRKSKTLQDMHLLSGRERGRPSSS